MRMNSKAQNVLDLTAQKPGGDAAPRLRRRASGLMALEPRFMFDGAGAGQIADATALAVDRVGQYLASASDAQLADIFDGGGQRAPAWMDAAQSLRETLGSQMAALQVRTVDSATLHGAWGAFAAQGPDGQPVIYLNADWLAGGAATEDVARVLVEEMGHAIDAKLNPQADSTGDEGELFGTHVFATAAVSDSYRAMLKAQDDHQVLTIDGQEVAVEFAALNFKNAYAVYTSSVNGNVFLADKEQNRHHFDPTLLGVASISDGTNGQSFSGNDVSVDLVIGGTHYYGWISRPIKDQGIVRGFYFWKDAGFSTVSAAQTDGNQDRDGTATDNSGFILVVDQDWFSSIGFETGGTYKFVGSSSDRVDTALNSVMPSNSAPTPVNDSKTIAEDSGLATGNVLTNDSDPNSNTLSVTQFVINGTTYSSASLGTDITLTSGTFRLNADGSYQFTPASNFTGTVPPITYTVSDSQSSNATATAVLSITVTPAADPPTATGDTASTSENTPLVLGLSDFGSFSDLDGDSLAAIKITSLPTEGTLQYWTGSVWASVDLTTNSEFTVADVLAGKLRFVPDTNESGANYATIGFKVKDSSGSYSVSSYNLVVSVTAVNTAPVANADNADGASYAVEQGATVTGSNQTGNVLTNDTDPDGTLTAGTSHWVTQATSAALTTQVSVTQATTSTSSPASVTGLYGTLKIGGDGSYIYEVNNANAQVQALLPSSTPLTETFTYTMRDSTGATSTSTLKVVINGSNDAPVAVDDRDSVQETTGFSSGGQTIYGTTSGNVITPNDSDVDHLTSALTISGSYAEATGSSAGTTTVTLTGSGLSSINTLDYVYINGASPTLLTVGGVAVRVSTSNNGQITLDNSNALRVNDQNMVFANGDTLGFYSTSTYSGSGNYKTATYSGSSVAASTTVSVSGITGAISQGMTVVVGSDTRTVSALNYDANGAITQITLNSSVTWQNATLAFSASSGTTLTGKYGTLTLDSDGSYTYKLTRNTLNSGESFVEQFSYRVKDSLNATDDGILYIRADGSTGVTTDDEAATTNEDTTLTVLATDANALLTGDTTVTTVTSFTWGGTTANAGQTISIAGVGDLQINSDGGYVFTPATDYTGPVPTALYNATDGATPAATGSGQLALSITAVNDAPTSTHDAVTTPEDTAIVLRATDFGAFSDTEGSSLAAVKVTTLETDGALQKWNGSAWVDVALNDEFTAADLAAGKLRFNPDANENGNAYTTVGFKVSDGTDWSASAYTLTVNVTPVNDAPVNTVPGDQTVSENGTLSITGLSVDDVDGPSDISSVVLSVSNGTLSATVASGQGTISGTGTGTVTLTGTKAQLDTILGTLQYSPTAGYAGADALKIVTTDTAGAKDTDYVPITVGADSRALAVTGTTVNEASPYVRFNVDGEVGQRVRLVLGETANAGGNATMGTDFLPNLQYFDGTIWQDYNGGFVTIPSTLSGGANTNGLLLVRTRVLQDSTFESTSANYETLQLTAYNAAGGSAAGTSKIVDDGTGDVYLASNTEPSTPSSSGSGGYPAYLDNDTPVSVNNLSINEGSPWAVFTVTGTIGQKVGFTLHDGSASKEDGNGTVLTDGTEDFGPDLEIWDPSANSNAGGWVSYTAGNAYTLAAATTYVRTAINPDTVYEGQHNFFLGVTRKAAGDTKYGTGNIYDDGTGVKYDGSFSGGSPATSTASLDDDRTVSVNAPTVNEASDYVVFTVTGNSGQTASLRLVEETGTGKANIDETQTLQVWDGRAWVNYNPNNLPTFDANGKIFVRVSITAEQDAPYEGSETFKLEAQLSGQTSWASGTATIKDDGTGVKYDGTFTSGSPTTSSSGLEDDRILTVNNPTVNEGSPYAVFEVTGTAGDTAALSLANASGGVSGRADLRSGGSLPTIQVLVNGSWVDYDPNNLPVIPGSGPLYVRVSIAAEQDPGVDGPETFKLVATNASNIASLGGTATIVDDGTGSYFASGNTSGTSSVPAGVTLDDDDPALAINNVTVNEGSPYTVFEVSGAVGQTASLSLSNASGGAGSRADLRSQGQLPTLQVYVGGQWTNYSGSSLPQIPAGGRLLVRVAIGAEQEKALDGPETFKLVATTASNRASTGGTATIVDDGTGNYYAADNTTGTSTVPAGVTLDDDRSKAAPPKAEPPAPPVAPPAAPAPASEPAPARPAPSFSSALAPAARAPASPDFVVPQGESLTSGAGFRVVVNSSAQAGLTVYRGITDQFVEQGAGTKVSLPYDAFIHTKEDAVIRLDAKNADDSPLPAWVRFDPANGTFDVAPPTGFQGRLDVKVIARDDDGREATVIFRMFVGEQQNQQGPAIGPQSRESFTEKLRLAARKPVIVVRQADGEPLLRDAAQATGRDAEAVHSKDAPAALRSAPLAAPRALTTAQTAERAAREVRAARAG